MSWRLHREIVLLAGWGRAILMQLAHPLVAQGVLDHSAVLREPGAHVRRLRRTLGAMLDLTFGSEADADAAAARINAIHDRVHGALAAGGGAYPPGTRYSAHDPALLAWVHATLLDSFLLTYRLFVGPLSTEDEDRYCAESSAIEPRLGIPIGLLPRTRDALDGYLCGELASGRIAVTDGARALAREIVAPPLPWPARPLLALARLPTIGLLPPALREAYGLHWTPGRERMLRLVARTSRVALAGLPSALRHWPAARRARARSAPG